ncbi:MAG TPA: VIT and VWA domain-containing protein [Pyrinomonadaceae bacterium]|nr:VIT and VWA domain-containing protein [Pyrinomonadaceae bacterium]
MRKLGVVLSIMVCAIAAAAQTTGGQRIGHGTLSAYAKDGTERGDCPLKTTAVGAEISGFLARVRVRQEFETTYPEAVEAIYTFPLSHTGAVDDMTMTVGSRTIKGKIMKREDARVTYDAAKTHGKTASLLDQERPNIFTQSVANIMPGEKVVIDITYVETLKYEDGSYEFVFPMTVAPRYIPSTVNDAAKIRPPYAAGRPGHDISLEVILNAGVPIEEIRSTSHAVNQINYSPNLAKIVLRAEKTIPNKDFILRYDVTGNKLQDGLLTHRGSNGGFFTLILQPPDKIAAEDRTPKEIVFVLDTSGSMSGFPILKAKEAMRLSLAGLYPDDTFNFITFSGDTEILFPSPVPATHGNVLQAMEFLETRTGSGGTVMMKAVRAALEPSDSQTHLRIVCFMTDGHVGNDSEIIAEVQRHPNARVFTFGIGNSVNRFLLDKIAEVGNGEAEYISLTDDGSKAAQKLYERVRTPLLTNLSLEWKGLPVADIYPTRLTDLFSSKPIIVHGRYTGAAEGRVRLKGRLAGQEYVRDIAISLPEKQPANSALASVWARTRIDELSSEKLRRENASSVGNFDKQILDLGLEFRVITQFTSFVAVEDQVVNHGGTTKTIQVPVAVPEGQNGFTAGRSPNGPGRNDAHLRSSAGYFSYSNGPGSGGGRTLSLSTVPAVALPGSQVGTPRRQIVEAPIQSRDASELVALVPSPPAAAIAGGIAKQPVDPRANFFWVKLSENADKRRLAPGRVLHVAEPVLSDAAKSVKPVPVEVAIAVAPDGTVVEANAVTGSESFQNPSVEAARATRFTRMYDEYRAPIRMSASITYEYNPSTGKTKITLKNTKAEPLTENDRQSLRLSEKLHTSLYEMIMRQRNGIAEADANEALFVRDGNAHVRIELRSAESTTANLIAAGLEIYSVEGKIVKGRMPVLTLSALADIEEVKYAAPIY